MWFFCLLEFAGKDRRQEKGMTEDEMVGWQHQLNGHEFEQTLGDGEGQGSLACCSPWGRKESDMTEWLNNKEVIDSLLSTKMKIFWRIDFCSDKSYPLFLRPDSNRLYLWFDKACYYLLIASLTTCLYANFNISVSRSVVSDSLWPHGLQPTGVLCPWNFPGKDTGVGCHFLLQEIFPTQGSNLGLLHCRQIL